MSIVTTWTLQQYERMVETGVFSDPRYRRLELIRGEICEMTPIGDDHAFTVDMLTEWSVENRPKSEAIIRIQSPIRIPALESAPEPDVVWYRRDAAGSHPNPSDVLLVIEVADTSASRDRGEKADLYAEAGIGDYWVVDCSEKSVEVFREPTPTGYEQSNVYRGDEEIRLLAYPEIAFRPAIIFAD